MNVNHIQRFLLIGIALTMLTLSAFTQAEQIKTIDRIVAIVDQSVITESELIKRMQSVAVQMQKQGQELPDDEKLQKQVLERLIVDSLQLQFAERVGIKIDDGQLDMAIMRIAEKNNMSVEQFKQAVQQDGVSFYKFREDIRSEIAMAKLKDREVNNRITVSESEVDNYLTTQANRVGEQDEYNISAILIKTPQDLTPEDIQTAKDRTEQVLQALSEGMTFEKASSSYSDAPNALEGGTMGWRSAEQIPPLFFESLKGMETGGITRPMRGPNGIYILKLNDRRDSNRELMVDQSNVRHILLKPSEVLSESEAKHKIDIIRERIINGTSFEEMARQYSDDSSAASGGSLGWVNTGDTVPDFENAMNALSIGDVSQPVLTPFGWHLIQVLERRKKDMTQQATRINARRAIRARKADEAYNDWIRELRDKAYVELRLEDTF